MHRIGIDVGGTKIEAVMVDSDGRIVSTRRIPARRGSEQVVADVSDIAADVAGELIGDAMFVGIGIPGQVDSSTGRIDNVVNLDIDTLDLGARVGERLGLPAHVENDVNAAAIGAARLLGGPTMDGTIAFVNFGTGLAAGIVIDGHVQHGASGAAGEIGHVPVDPNHFACACGQWGCLETVCSGASVARLWPCDGPAMPDLIERARNGEGKAVHVLGMVTHAIADTLQIVAQSVDPRLIVLGGGMAKTGQPLVDVIADELHAREVTCPFLKGLDLTARLRLAPADQPLGALGAAWSI